jgi:hypothetical protein
MSGSVKNALVTHRISSIITVTVFVNNTTARKDPVGNKPSIYAPLKEEQERSRSGRSRLSHSMNTQTESNVIHTKLRNMIQPEWH